MMSCHFLVFGLAIMQLWKNEECKEAGEISESQRKIHETMIICQRVFLGDWGEGAIKGFGVIEAKAKSPTWVTIGCHPISVHRMGPVKQ